MDIKKIIKLALIIIVSLHFLFNWFFAALIGGAILEVSEGNENVKIWDMIKIMPIVMLMSTISLLGIPLSLITTLLPKKIDDRIIIGFNKLMYSPFAYFPIGILFIGFIIYIYYKLYTSKNKLRYLIPLLILNPIWTLMIWLVGFMAMD